MPWDASIDIRGPLDGNARSALGEALIRDAPRADEPTGRRVTDAERAEGAIDGALAAGESPKFFDSDFVEEGYVLPGYGTGSSSPRSKRPAGHRGCTS